MDYRFEISKPDSNDFRCEIAINGEQTFQQLHDKLVETLNFDGSQMASFFTLDKMGNRGKEIALMEIIPHTRPAFTFLNEDSVYSSGDCKYSFRCPPAKTTAMIPNIKPKNP